ncbi:HEAT repeat domain-containing protein [Streptomyces sp. NPDC051776]|uniref:HEAT repeat domain-containing protein n=1 Tax=Streptomyces sp. NPDC051776 TaxID=3155414 RepID=UPI003420E3D3
MAVEKDDLVRALRAEVPHYAAIASSLGPEATPALEELAASDDTALASRAATVAAYLTPDSARTVLRRAAAHHDPVVRVSAAAALGRQPELSSELTGQLLTDTDPGVRKWTLRSLQTVRPVGYREQVAGLARSERVPFLRDLAHEVARQLPS